MAFTTSKDPPHGKLFPFFFLSGIFNRFRLLIFFDGMTFTVIFVSQRAG